MIDTILGWIASHPYETVGLVLVPAVPLALFNLLAILVVMERRGAAFIQDRPGPNRCGIWIPGLNTRIRGFGTILNLADFLKLATKEEFLPRFASAGYYVVGPFIPLLIGLILPAFLPFFAPMAYQTADGLGVLMGETISSQSGLLLLFAFSSLSVYGIVLGSWASNSKFSLLGGMRSSAMMISYEVSIGLSAAGMFLICGSFNLGEIVAWQGAHAWGLFVQPLGFVLFLVAMFAECNRNPFDVVEGESEIVAGFHTEYGAMRFMTIMSAEYLHVIVASALISTLFLGGYHLSPVPLPLGEGGTLVSLTDLGMRQNLGNVLALVLGVTAAGLLAWAWFINGRRRWYLGLGTADGPQRAKEYLLYIGGFTTVAVAALIGAVLVAGWHPQPVAVVQGVAVWGWKVDLITGLVQFHTLIVKALLVAWLFVWVRWTLPRFRYDQIMSLGWKVLLNLALINLLATAVITRLVKG